MIQPPIKLGEFSVDDLLAPAEPPFLSTLDEFEHFRVGSGRLHEYFASGEAEASSRVMACPSLIGYLMDQVAKGRSQIIDSESAGRVSDTVVRNLEQQVIAGGGRSVKSPENVSGHASTFMLIGSTAIQYDQDGDMRFEFDDPNREGEQFGYVEAFTLPSAEEAAEYVQDLVVAQLNRIENKALVVAETSFRRPQRIEAGV